MKKYLNNWKEVKDALKAGKKVFSEKYKTNYIMDGLEIYEYDNEEKKYYKTILGPSLRENLYVDEEL